MKVLLITPPMTQINTPYPATAYLTRFLLNEGIDVTQRDLGLDLFHALFSKTGLIEIKKIIDNKENKNELEEFFLDAFNDYHSTIDVVKNFLKGNDPSLAIRISKRMLLPEGPRFVHFDNHQDEIENLFGDLGVHDKAKYLSSLYLDDLSDIVKNSIDSDFEFSRYGESLASSNESFNELNDRVLKNTLIDQIMLNVFDQYLSDVKPNIIGITLPFPGNVLSALKMSKYLKDHYPEIKIIAGGGFVNTELRELSDRRFFNYIDYLIFDDGELPILKLIHFLDNKENENNLIRTWYLKNDQIIKSKNLTQNISFSNLDGPTYLGLDLHNYIPMLEMPNPMHRMWSDFKWNKMILAHGCYFKKCTFCDTSLDYINRYEPLKVDSLIKSIKRIMAETNHSGFHFVDEAAPPALVRSFSEKLIEEDLKITWWGNLRFDKQFENLAPLMADAGCVAVTGGLEVAGPRVLKLINKGITIEQVAKVTKSFSRENIFVHSYLMYGFPTQTIEETIDSLEIVRQLFLNECIQSAFWHRFMCTAHSPVGLNPEKFNIELIDINIPREGLFAKNTIFYNDPTRPNLDLIGDGLKKATYNYMHGIGLDEDVRAWFDFNIPKSTISKNFIKKSISQ